MILEWNRMDIGRMKRMAAMTTRSATTKCLDGYALVVPYRWKPIDGSAMAALLEQIQYVATLEIS
jgi:hypothetical protein